MLFKKTKTLIKDMEILLSEIQQTGLLFYEAMREYFSKDFESFSKRVAQIKLLENKIDKHRKNIEYRLYTDMLIPESRGDVLGLLETLDKVANTTKSILVDFDIERPEFPASITHEFIKIAEISQRAISELINAVTSFFTSQNMTNNYIQQVCFYEHEVDELQERLKREVFGSKEIKKLSQKVHLRYFINTVANLTDCAEDVCHRLTISMSKRAI